MPHECPSRLWQVAVDGKHVNQPSVSVSVGSEVEVNAYRADAEKKAASVVKGTSCVIITGATGPSATIVNGIYEPTEEMCCNATVYRKVGDRSMWMEYNASLMSWQIKPNAWKGETLCYAYNVVPAK